MPRAHDKTFIIIIYIIYFLGNGFIEGQELDGFLREFVTSVNTDDVEVSSLLHFTLNPRVKIKELSVSLCFFPL